MCTSGQCCGVVARALGVLDPANERSDDAAVAHGERPRLKGEGGGGDAKLRGCTQSNTAIMMQCAKAMRRGEDGRRGEEGACRLTGAAAAGGRSSGGRLEAAVIEGVRNHQPASLLSAPAPSFRREERKLSQRFYRRRTRTSFPKGLSSPKYGERSCCALTVSMMPSSDSAADCIAASSLEQMKRSAPRPERAASSLDGEVEMTVTCEEERGGDRVVKQQK